MPAYEYSREHKAFIKQCSCCKEVFVGTDNEDSTIEVLKKHFALSNGSAQTADGFQSRCGGCNSWKRRQLKVDTRLLESMWLAQEGKCAICSKNISILRGANANEHAHVDHDETTGAIRDLLCGNCNRGIGCFHHDVSHLRVAADYVLKHLNINVVKLGRKA